MGSVLMVAVINCRFLTQPLTGVQRFAEEISELIVPELGDVMLIAPHGPLRRTELGGVRVQQVGRLRGHLWEQFELARFVLDRHALLLSLANTGPVVVRRQVLVIHDITWLHFPGSYSTKFRLAYGILTRLLVHRVRELVTVSDFSRRDIASRYGLSGRHIAVVPNAVASRLRQSSGEQPLGSPSKDFLLVVSSLNQHKNIGALVDAYTRYADRGSGVPDLVLVGGSGRAFAHAGVESTDSARGVIALGRVSDAELVWLYRNARAFLFPSLYEGFGIPPIEAQALGCPVASSNAASLPEVLKDSVDYFDPHDPVRIVQSLVRLEDKCYLDELSRRGTQNAQRYQWEDSARGLLNMLETER